MVTIVKKKGENNEAMFRKFGRLIMDENLQDEIRGRMYYIKPSQIRKEKEKNRGKRPRKVVRRGPDRRVT